MGRNFDDNYPGFQPKITHPKLVAMAIYVVKQACGNDKMACVYAIYCCEFFDDLLL